MQRNLFPTWWDSLLTVIFGAVAVWGAVSLVQFLVTADYTIIRVNLANFIVGRFPRDELWRPAGALVVTMAAVGLMAGATSAAARAVAIDEGASFRPSTIVENLRRQWPLLVTIVILLLLAETWSPRLTVAAAVAAAYLTFVAGRWAPRRVRRLAWVVALVMLGAAYAILTVAGGVGWGGWGGIQLNIFLTVAGILLAFPLGLMLALGRRSSLPAVRLVSVSYIELIRGVPLITLLLMGIFAIGFFLPAGIRPGPVARVLIAITLFEAAYIAEVVRGGLQSVHPGQVEASQALGMAPWKTTRLIVLPQALRATIPAMVGQFISLFKDTTLVSLVGLFDVLTISGVANAQPAFLAQGLETVTLPFVGLMFWVGSYAMSREARRLERKLGVGER
ncbi:amino acid ABC transporter permease [soil metagenome]